MSNKIIKSIKFKCLSIKTHLKSIKEKRQLKAIGIEHSKFVGWSPTNLRTYYSGFLDSNHCFIKIANNDSASSNELFVLEQLKNYDFSFIPDIYLIDRDFHKKSLLITSFHHNYGIDSIINDFVGFDTLCSTFINILDDFYKIGFVHGDLHQGNIIIDEQKNIKIIDFGIGTFINGNQFIDYIKHYGTYYLTILKNGKTIRRYDDAYSIVQLIKAIPIPINWIKSSNFSKLEKLIGRLYFDVTIS